ncbi:unnamed protein product [Lepeophtheirus salmonis]|uniref:(salmon louse) hypothetical protein n=1 Tax=Lepeophtheirus salmonis TaxID=72036 RepID=A0A7R8CJ86_LEPSM|nr:unnamed protein product [Lepeophtheirus salmonis]CAF2839171.1 unnamed protein product [Lepeophtheirus salmonis]
MKEIRNTRSLWNLCRTPHFEALMNPISLPELSSTNISMFEKIQTEREPEKIDGVQVNNSAISREENLQTNLRALTSRVQEGVTESVKSSIISGSMKSYATLLEELSVVKNI